MAATLSAMAETYFPDDFEMKTVLCIIIRLNRSSLCNATKHGQLRRRLRPGYGLKWVINGISEVQRLW